MQGGDILSGNHNASKAEVHKTTLLEKDKDGWKGRDKSAVCTFAMIQNVPSFLYYSTQLLMKVAEM